jgi:tetratricopeptide (TPR) repeat protein
MYTQIFKEILFELEYNEQSVQNLVHYCRERYEGNINELNIINEFAHDYRPESAIWWYTRECFTYQMLNRALRTLESDIIMKMGFFIRDLHQQIEKLHREQFSGNQNKVFTVYRGQCLSVADFEKLEKSKGGLISFNSFLSTSKSQDISLEFAKCASFRTESVGVLFKMNINPSTPSTPFAFIKNLSNIESEEEVLFSMHSVYRIGEIEKIENKNRLYQVTLTLTSDNDRQLQNLTEQIRKETSPDSKGWYRMGELLLKLGEFDKAEQLYSAVLEGTPGDKEQADIYYQLGRIKNRQGDYEKAISFYEKELEIDQKSFSSNPIPLAYTYNNIGTVYDSMKEYSNAQFYYEKALEIYQKHLPPDHQDLAASYNNIGFLYNNMGEYSKALSYYQKALEIKQKTLPPNHPLLATAYNNIATVFYNMKEYSNVLSFYEKAMEIEQKTLPSNHPDLATTYNNIAVAYEKMKEYSKALSFYERALAIKQSILPSDHPNLQEIQEDIDYIKKKL